jgi:hypothetical protein
MDPIVLENLQTAYEQISALIVGVTANPNPDYSENGRSIPKAQYLSMLIDKQEKLAKAIQVASGPFEIRA